MFIGKGAGSNPTGSAVLSDIAALRYDYQYEYRKLKQAESITVNEDELIKVYFRYNSSNKIDTSLFENVYEQYVAADYSYIIADVSLHDWRKAQWYLQEDVNFFIFT